MRRSWTATPSKATASREWSQSWLLAGGKCGNQMNMKSFADKLLRESGSVGNISIVPQQVGAVSIVPQQVGLPVKMATGDGRAVAVEERGYLSGGLTFCGLPRVNVANGATDQRITVNVRRPFVPQLLQMPSTTTGLDLVEFGTQGIGLFASDSPQVMPQECVSEVSRMPQIQWPTLDTNRPGFFLVNNASGAAVLFRGVFWGTNLIPQMGS